MTRLEPAPRSDRPAGDEPEEASRGPHHGPRLRCVVAWVPRTWPCSSSSREPWGSPPPRSMTSTRYWHVAIGREIVARHTLTGLGRQWLGVDAPRWGTSQWLSEVLMYGAVDRFGWIALPALRLVGAAGLFAILWLTLVRRRQPIAAFVVVLGPRGRPGGPAAGPSRDGLPALPGAAGRRLRAALGDGPAAHPLLVAGLLPALGPVARTVDPRSRRFRTGGRGRRSRPWNALGPGQGGARLSRGVPRGDPESSGAGLVRVADAFPRCRRRGDRGMGAHVVHHEPDHRLGNSYRPLDTGMGPNSFRRQLDGDPLVVCLDRVRPRGDPECRALRCCSRPRLYCGPWNAGPHPASTVSCARPPGARPACSRSPPW